jgi:hypothetical protein
LAGINIDSIDNFIFKEPNSITVKDPSNFKVKKTEDEPL